MKTSTTLLAIVMLAAVGAGSYWLGARAPSTATGNVAAVPAPQPAPPRKLLYYRNPMGLADTSPTPKKDPMGMDYIAVYEGEEAPAAPASGSAATVVIGTEKIQKLGVRTQAAVLRPLGRAVRAAGRVEPDERRVTVIAPKFEGYVERLLVNATGQSVAKGQPLFEAYSPDLVSAQREYAIAVQGLQAMKGADADAQGGMRQLAESSLAHLRHWELAPEQIAALMRTGQPERNVTFISPVAGVVTEKKAVQGMRFMPGEVLYQITDLSSVWVMADVPEQDIGALGTGTPARITFDAYPGETFVARVSQVYPTLKAETRTVAVRMELANPGARLKPAMYAQVEFAAGGGAAVLSVPDSAVIDTGTRRIVLVQLQPGRFEPREVRTGARSLDAIEIISGIRAGEEVVVAANFLIDAESNLKAAFGGLGGPEKAAPPEAGARPGAAAPGAAASAPRRSGAASTPRSAGGASAAPPPGLDAGQAGHSGH